MEWIPELDSITAGCAAAPLFRRSSRCVHFACFRQTWGTSNLRHSSMLQSETQPRVTTNTTTHARIIAGIAKSPWVAEAGTYRGPWLRQDQVLAQRHSKTS